MGIVMVTVIEIQALTLSHHHHPASPPPPSLPCQPRQGGGMVSYQRFWGKTGGRRPNPARSHQHTGLRRTILHEFLRISVWLWGPNMRGARCHLLRLFCEGYLKYAFFCIEFFGFWQFCFAISRVMDAFSLQIQRIPPCVVAVLHFEVRKTSFFV